MNDQPKPRNPALGLPLHEFPYPWASDWGEDEYGIWVAFTYRDVRYAFRWMTPGTFLMGSPVNEPERHDGELQHQVTLTKGFWLGETTVTEALWQAVIGNKPSNFEDRNRPVKQVSWENVQAFIQAFHVINGRLGLRLPTEAEWEYACRGGTATPFHFGHQITTDQVNYNGNNPYNNGGKGDFRAKPVDVGALPCNIWGLWEMHGNVLEWCVDWYGDYAASHAVDPSGPGTGDRRVIRGGSWISSARLCRSACRDDARPSLRNDLVGFRLAADHFQDSSSRSQDASS